MTAFLDGGGLVGVYDVATGKRIALIEGRAEKITGAAFSGDDRTLVTVSRGSICLWNLPSGTRKRAIVLPKKCMGVTSPVLTADGKTLVVVVIWELNLRLRDDRYNKVLASHMQPREVRYTEIFDVPSGKSRGRMPWSLFALSPDSRTLAGAVDYKCIELWDLASVKKTGTLKCASGVLSSMIGATMRLRFSPDGRKLARAFIAPARVGKRGLGPNGCVELLDLAGGASRMLKVDDISSAPVMAFSADSRTLAAAGANGGILLWDISKPPKDPAAP